MKVAVTGATGLIGSRVVAALADRGDEVTVLSRNPAQAAASLGVDAVAWDPAAGPAPAEALGGRDVVIHLAGENVAQRWTAASKQAIRDSREAGTRNLVAGIEAADPRPGALVSASAVGYYGPHGDEIVEEPSPPGGDFLAEVCVAWEREAAKAEDLGLRVALMRTGIVLAPDGGALAKMLPPFKLGVGGPIAGGRHYMPWVHVDDVVGMIVAAADGTGWAGPINVTAPEPVTNAAFSKALGRALHRPAVAPVPALALKLLYGEMAEIITTGQRAVPARAAALGYAHRHPALDAALAAALAR